MCKGRREGSLTHVPDVTLVGEQYRRVGSERVEQDAERFVRCRIDQVVVPVDLVRFQIGHTQIVIARYVARGVRVVENLLGEGENRNSHDYITVCSMVRRGEARSGFVINNDGVLWLFLFCSTCPF